MMVDDYGAALDGGPPCDDDDENSSPERRLAEFLPAAMIVALAFTIVSAVLRTSEPQAATARVETSAVDAGATSVASGVSTLDKANLRLTSLPPLRAALKEMSADRTASIQQTLPASAMPAPPRERSFRLERRGKVASVESRANARLLARRDAKPKHANPLTVVGSTAGAMAERFATDLRALPSQISAIFNRN